MSGSASGGASGGVEQQLDRFGHETGVRRVSIVGRHQLRGWFVIDPPDKAESALGHRADEVLAFTAVANGAPRRADAGAERRLRDDAALPDRLDQLVLADDSVAVADQIEQQIEHLRLDADGLPASAQFVLAKVDLKLAESDSPKVLPSVNPIA